jgi:hypothetical protein
MPLPRLSDSQIAWISEQVARYIDRQRQKYRPRAVPLDRNQRTAVQSFFAAATLDSARVIVLAGQRVGNPPFYGELIKMGFAPGSLPDFGQMAAVTYVDTVVSHGPFTDRILFHELVHVLQYEKLGLESFAAKYVSGFLNGGSYEAIPLERNAYQLDERFAAAPANSFSVADEIQAWIDAHRF